MFKKKTRNEKKKKLAYMDIKKRLEGIVKRQKLQLQSLVCDDSPSQSDTSLKSK